jgi:hypothetical protein
MRLLLALLFLTFGFQSTAAVAPYGYLVGSLNYAPTASCLWTSASTSWAVFTADTDCPTPTVSGSVTAAGTKIPGFLLTVKKGTYVVVANSWIAMTSQNVAAYMSVRISDGTLFSGMGQARSMGVIGGVGTSIPYGGPVVGTFTYTAATAGAKTFQMQGTVSSASNTVDIGAATGTTYEYQGLDFKVYYFPPAPVN